MSRLKWNYKRYIEFFKSYGFVYGHTEGSHHSGIPKKYYEEWDKTGAVHKEIIY
ncbi:MAG: hypothetical protein ABIG60_05875 [Patescibacteria group bacterium]